MDFYFFLMNKDFMGSVGKPALQSLPGGSCLKLHTQSLSTCFLIRFLQLLCENHNKFLQNLLRDQNNKTKYNLVSETLILLGQ